MKIAELKTPYTIEIADQQTLVTIDRPLLRRVARGTLRAEQVHSAHLSIALVDDDAIWQVNRDFLEHDFPTDVISFLYESDAVPPAAETAVPVGPLPRGAYRQLAGEIVISAEYALRTADEYGWKAHDELLLYLVHGILHLCGYDDLTRKEQRVMRTREAQVLALFQLTPRYRTETQP